MGSRDLSDGFAGVFAEHQRDALRLAFVLCGDAAQAEDAVAEAFARMYPHWRRGRVDDAGAYLRRAVLNQVRGRFRRRVLERREEERRTVDGRGVVLDGVERLADRDVLRRALDCLPVRQRAAVVLRFLEDLPEAEVAALMGTSVGTVKAQVSRGLGRLRVVLDGDADVEGVGRG